MWFPCLTFGSPGIYLIRGGKNKRNCVCVCVCGNERGSEESTQAGQRGFPSLYGTRVSGIKPSPSLGFDRHYTYISMGADTARELGSTHSGAINTQTRAQSHEPIQLFFYIQLPSGLLWPHMCSIQTGNEYSKRDAPQKN